MSSTKVREHADVIGIKRLLEFEDAYDRQFEDTVDYARGTPKKAWEGKSTIGFKYAQQIAALFGISHYLILTEDQGETPWEKVLKEETLQSDFIDFRLARKSGSGMFDIPFLESTLPNSLDQINIEEQFYLKFKGKPSHRFMAVLQSKKESFQLAPLNHEGFDNIIHPGKNSLRYPSQNSLQFDKESGLGWRRLVVIRSSQLTISTKSFEAGRPQLSSEALDSFARRLLFSKNSFEVDQYEFQLVSTKTIHHQFQ